MADSEHDLERRMSTHRAHGARIYDYILGGKDNYAADRAAAEATLQVWPGLTAHMRANRAFMHRAARFLVRDCGVRQFLDIGTGIPTSPNLHETVQGVAPDARVVYTDNDPIVLAHAQALLVSSPAGRTAYLDGDMRDPEAILASPAFRDTLDLRQPIGLMLIAVVHFVDDDVDAHRVVQRLVDAMPSGSYLAATVATDQYMPEPLARVREIYRAAGEVLRWSTRDQAERYFTGLELVTPGLVQMHKWRPDTEDGSVADRDIAMWGGVARKA